MHRAQERRAAITHYILSLWRTYALSLGFVVALVALSPLVRKWLLPVFAFLFFIVLMMSSRSNCKSDRVTCFRFAAIMKRVIFTAMLILIALNLWLHNATTELTGQPINHSQPYLVNMIMAPLLTIFTGIYLLMGKKRGGYCRSCNACAATAGEIGFIGNILSKESKSQTRMVFWMSLLISILEWYYYYNYYITVNINTPDSFIFLWLPMAVYVLSLIYLGIRYYSMWAFYCYNDGLRIIERSSTSSLRYLIIHGDQVYLKLCDRVGEKDYGEFDTPARVRVSYRENVRDDDAVADLKSLTGIKQFSMRFLYRSANACTLNNAFHYMCYVDDPVEIDESRIGGGKWMTLSDVNRLLHERKLAFDLMGEINRVYTIAMAWKTYDRDGNRLYKIKHYRPTFRLSDIKDWKVDFKDQHWLTVAVNNEDRAFFKLRRFWRRHIEGKEY